MSGRIPETVVDEISRKIDILSIVGAYVNLTRKGSRWWGLCPFHTEKTPSFSVSQDSNLYYCFGCRKGGSTFNFLMEMEGLSFLESVRKLAEQVGVTIPDGGGDPGYRDKRRALEDLYLRVSKTFSWLLLNRREAGPARDYLGNRGIGAETVENYRLGWAPPEREWLYDFLVEKDYSPEFLRNSGLFSARFPRMALFADRLMFPVMRNSERVLAFSGRALGEQGPKYINSPDTLLYSKSREIYGLAQAKPGIRRSKRIILCEGNMDVLSCAEAGFTEAAAPLGTAFTDDQARLLKRQADTVVLAFDGDDAGRRATMKAAAVAEKAGMAVEAVKIPPGRDPADILEKNGPEPLKKILSGPINFFGYLLDYVISAKTPASGEAQEEALIELTPFLNAVESDVRREGYLKQLAEAMGAEPKSVMHDYYRKRRKAGERTKISASSVRDDSQVIGDELYLMLAVAIQPKYFSVLRTLLAPEMLRDKRALSVYRTMDELAVTGSTPRTDRIVAKISDAELAGLIVEKASTELFDQRVEETMREKIQLIRTRYLSEERLELIKALARDETTESNRTEARIRRIKDIDQEIMNIRQGNDGGN